ncbi:hypothetical protein GE09DRAFT_187973 [Coniochaeta sp. 2T2.1]|nr:hypothetical protein GE09DRAFT_187973 [Coniochaeta sp. 2T2.1]
MWALVLPISSASRSVVIFLIPKHISGKPPPRWGWIEADTRRMLLFLEYLECSIWTYRCPIRTYRRTGVSLGVAQENKGECGMISDDSKSHEQRNIRAVYWHGSGPRGVFPCLDHSAGLRWFDFATGPSHPLCSCSSGLLLALAVSSPGPRESRNDVATPPPSQRRNRKIVPRTELFSFCGF